MRSLSVLLIFMLLVAFCAPSFAQQHKASDDQIYDQVRRKLANDAVVKGGALDVQVNGGVVTLRGKVKEEKQKKRAEHLTKKVKGVSKVINELAVSPAGQSN